VILFLYTAITGIIIMNLKNTIQAVSFSLLASTIFMASAQAHQLQGSVAKSSGATTPYTQDFPANALAYLYMSSGYNDNHKDRMFLETFKIKKCNMEKAKFTIKLKRLGAQDYNDGLHLVSNNNNGSNGTPYHSVTPIWSPNDPSATKTITHNFSSSDLTKISNGRFSFFVQDDTSVRSAQLTYKCKCGSGSKTINATPMLKSFNSNRAAGFKSSRSNRK
jgi:hypothetical protein